MSALEPGLYRATVRGVADQIVMVVGDGVGYMTKEVNGCLAHFLKEITDARPLIVLDLEYPQIAVRALEMAFRDHTNGDARTIYRSIADQIEAQTKPPRLEEPGLWGVVRATAPCVSRLLFWVRDEQGWTAVGSNAFRVSSFEILIDPTLIRDGIES